MPVRVPPDAAPPAVNRRSSGHGAGPMAAHRRLSGHGRRTTRNTGCGGSRVRCPTGCDVPPDAGARPTGCRSTRRIPTLIGTRMRPPTGRGCGDQRDTDDARRGIRDAAAQVCGVPPDAVTRPTGCDVPSDAGACPAGCRFTRRTPSLIGTRMRRPSGHGCGGRRDAEARRTQQLTGRGRSRMRCPTRCRYASHRMPVRPPLTGAYRDTDAAAHRTRRPTACGDRQHAATDGMRQPQGLRIVTRTGADVATLPAASVARAVIEKVPLRAGPVAVLYVTRHSSPSYRVALTSRVVPA
jgi:hypothetical protein